MQTILTRYKPRIDAALVNLLSKQKESLKKVNIWGGDAIEKLIPFVTSGKTIRGSLVLFSYELFGGKIHDSVVDVAAALELLHSSLLIHDDIMDRDQLRRGNKSIYVQYQELFKKKNVHDPTHAGISLGICAGDLGFFIAFSTISILPISATLRCKLLHELSTELSHVGVAQMQDVDTSRRTESEILSLYKYKTARYTFSLPLAIGGILAQQSASTIKQLEALGEHLGILFQIVDDELNLFGDTKTTGKPVGSDLREHKQTLYYYYAKKLLPKDIWKEIEAITSRNLSTNERNRIKTSFQTYGIIDRVDKKKRELINQTKKDILSLHLTKAKKETLTQLSFLLLTRTK